MTDEVVLDAANDVLDRLFMLSDAITDARAFRALLEVLHARDLSAVTGRQADAVAMVRAAILRSAIGAVMAVLDPEDSRRGNRASVGQILDLLEDADVAAMLTKRSGKAVAGAPTVESVRAKYAALVKSGRFARGRRLRNEKVAHVLVPDTPTPTVQYADIYALQDEAERLVTELHQLCDRAPPRFVSDRPMVEEHARTFWDTYLAGLRASE